MLDQPQGQTGARLLAELPLRLHHHAFAVKDQEANRHFIEDILGIPLVATWCERVFFADVGHEVEFCHTFFEIKDGGALAFFQYADEAAWKSRGAPDQDGGAQRLEPPAGPRRTQSNGKSSHDGRRASRTSSRVLRNSRCASASFAVSLP